MPLVTENFSDIITFTRNSTGTYFNSSGVLTSASTNVPRRDYNPITLEARGLLIEEQRTNSIRNNTMQGAVAGTPGTLPTNWVLVGSGLGTLTQTVVGAGTSGGISYIDIRLNGTTSTTSYGVGFESTIQISASVGQAWTSSIYLARVGGSTTNLTVNLRVIDRDAIGTNLGQSNSDITSTLGTTLSRFSLTRTLAGVGTAAVSNDVLFAFNSGVAIDITLRIGLPQLELGAFATSVISTTTIALTREPDAASVNTMSPWYTQAIGTVYAEFMSMVSGSASQTNGSQGVWSTTQSALGSFNGYGVTANLTAANAASITFRSRYAPTGKNDVVSVGLTSGYLNGNIVYKVASTWNASQITAASNVRTAITTTNNAAADMGTHDQMLLGNQSTGGTPPYQLNGWLRHIKYYPQNFSNTDLQTITA